MKGKAPNFSTFSAVWAQNGDISFDHWAFEVCSALANHPKVASRETIVWSLSGVVANLMWYLSTYAPVFQMVDKLELIFGLVASFDILMQNIYRLQQLRTKQMSVTNMEGALNAVQKDHPHILSQTEIHNHLQDWLCHGLKSLYTILCITCMMIQGFPVLSWWLQLERQSPGKRDQRMECVGVKAAQVVEEKVICGFWDKLHN